MVLFEDFSLLPILFGKKEIEAIMKKKNGQKLKQHEKNYLSRSSAIIILRRALEQGSAETDKGLSMKQEALTST